MLLWDVVVDREAQTIGEILIAESQPKKYLTTYRLKVQ